MHASQMVDTVVLARNRLQTFMRWLLATVLVYACLDMIVILIFPDRAILLAGLALFGYGCVVFVAWLQTRRHQLNAALTLVSGGLLALSLMLTLIFPAVTPAMGLLPIVVVAILLPHRTGRPLLPTIGLCAVTTLTISVLGAVVPPFTTVPIWLVNFYRVSSFPAVSTLVLVLLWQFSTRLHETLAHTQQINTQLHAAHAGLEAQVVQRTKALQAALTEVQTRAAEQAQLLHENEQQRATIRALSIPILPITSTGLVMPLIGELDPARLQVLQAQALHTIERTAARYLVLDITGIVAVDTVVAHGLMEIVQAARLLGTETFLVGIRPDVAQGIVGLGLSLHLMTFADLQTAVNTVMHHERSDRTTKRTS